MKKRRALALMPLGLLFSFSGAFAMLETDTAVGEYSGWWSCNYRAGIHNYLSSFDKGVTYYCVKNGDGYTMFKHTDD